MHFNTFIHNIPKINESELGGLQVQFKLAPEYRKQYTLTDIQKNKPREAAVLVLFFPDKDHQTSFILTERASYEGHHAGQISFQGGKKSHTDTSLQKTALRETFEEIGVKVPEKKVIKKLTQVYIPPSNFIVTPYIGFIDRTPVFQTNYEVKQVITPLLISLLDSNSIKTRWIPSVSGKRHRTPYFSLQNKIVWGATAMILSEVIDLLKKVNC